MKRKEKTPTRLILVRHLDTKARQLRDEIREDRQFIQLQELLGQSQQLIHNMPRIHELGSKLHEKYGLLDEDRILEILPQEEIHGRRIGIALVERYGMPDRWEVSPFRRTRQSSRAMRDGIATLGIDMLPEEVISTGLAERSFGDASPYTQMGIYLAMHPHQLLEHEKNPHRFIFQNGESRAQFARRIKRQVRAEKRARRYEGKTTVMVTHNLVIDEQLNQLLGCESAKRAIWTGTATVLEAAPKKFLQPRRYKLVGQIGQQLV